MSLIIDWLFPKNCIGCGKGDKYICNLCEGKMKMGELIRKDGFEGIITIYKYDSLIKKMIEKIKYEFVADAIDEMAKLVVKKLLIDYPNIVKYWQNENFCVVPIPLHKQRENWRGFNQSEILALKLSNILKLECKNNIIVRDIKTKNQAMIKNRQEKRKNFVNVFQMVSGIIAPQKVILVDDVITSGATMTAALKILKNSGTDQGWALALGGVLK